MALKVNKSLARSLGLEPKTKRPKKGPKAVDAKRVAFLAQCQAHGLPEPVPEFRFAKPRRFAFDYFFAPRLAVEIEGGLFGMGKPCPTCGRRKVSGHSSVERLKSDLEKYREAVLRGYQVLRFLPEEIRDGSAFPVIKRALEDVKCPYPMP